MAASKQANWFGEAAAGPRAAEWELAPEADFAASGSPVAWETCGVLIRRSGIFWVGLFFSGISASPLRGAQKND
jgi:hypothetical protein